jgi:hypothetical protein
MPSPGCNKETAFSAPLERGERKTRMRIITRSEILMNTCFVIAGVVAGVVLDALLP